MLIQYSQMIGVGILKFVFLTEMFFLTYVISL